MRASDSPIIFIASDTERMVTQDRDGLIKVFRLGEKDGYHFQHEIDTEYAGFARAQLFTDNKNHLVAPNVTSDIVVYDLPTKAKVQTMKPPSEEMLQLTSIFIIPWATDGETYLLAGYESGHLVLFDIKQSKAVNALRYDFPITALAYDFQSNRGFVGGPDNINVRVFGIDKESLDLYESASDTIEYLPLTNEKLYGISIIRIRDDRKCIVVGTCDGIVYVHSFKSLRKLATLRNEHRGVEITDIAFSVGIIDAYKSPVMAVSSKDGKISLWDIYYKYRSD